MASQAIVVLDVGKTLSKATLWTRDGHLLDRQVRPNEAVTIEGIRRLDMEGIGAWLIAALAKYRDADVGTIIPVGHGAGVVALRDGEPAFAPLDYEQDIPADVLARYRRERDDFAATGSPALPHGLNLGSQIYWMEQRDPAGMAHATLVPWAQYWAWLLTGRAVTEVTSLGCHSDLWNPAERRYSALAMRRGWSERFAPLAAAGDVVGTLRPEVARATGLPATVQVLAGLHDSNAALLAARGHRRIDGAEATILSTGTWFIAMRTPGEGATEFRLAENRDCLVNVAPDQRPVPSARFMGGREIETVIQIDTRRVDIRPDQPALLAAVPALVRDGAMLLPTLAPGCGPFPDGPGDWIARPDDWYARRAAACLYAALVTDAALDLIGTRERILIEGRFAEAEVFVRALASLRPDVRVYTANAHNDVSFGALRLLDPELRPAGDLVQAAPLETPLADYRERWLAALRIAA